MNIIQKFLIITLIMNCLGNLSLAQVNTQKSPEELGFSSEKLKQMETVIQDFVDNKKLSGVITLIARKGKIIEFNTYGINCKNCNWCCSFNML